MGQVRHNALAALKTLGSNEEKVCRHLLERRPILTSLGRRAYRDVRAFTRYGNTRFIAIWDVRSLRTRMFRFLRERGSYSVIPLAYTTRN